MMKELLLNFDVSAFEKIMENKLLGNFSGFKVLTIVATAGNVSYNFFTVIEAVSYEIDAYNNYIDKKIKVNLGGASWRFMLSTHFIKLQSIYEVLESACKNSILKDDKGKTLRFDKMVFCGHWFSPSSQYTSGESSYVKNIVDKEGENGSHVWEWAADRQESFSYFYDNPQKYRKLAKQIYDASFINIEKLYDKIGSLVMVVPVECLEVILKGKRGELDAIIVKTIWKDYCKKRNIVLTVYKEKDNLFSQKLYRPDEKGEVCLKNNEALNQKFVVYDVDNSIVLYGCKFAVLLKVEVRFNMVLDVSRVFADTMKRKITLKVNANRQVEGGFREHSALNHRWKKRNHNESLIEMSRQKDLIQYCPERENLMGEIRNKEQLRCDAINDIRYLIEKYGNNAVWLWDPYLSANDIIDTLFYNPHFGAKMRALTRSKHYSQSTEESKDYAAVLNKSLEEPGGMNVEFRTSAGSNLADFHDRFIIFPECECGPLAWSLGTSVNSLGTAHHLLQRVNNGIIIKETFEDMWNKLGDDKYLIWKI